MNKTLAIAAREISERRAILIAAAVGGLLPFASPLLPGVSSDRVGEARDAMALGIAIAFAGATALAMGTTTVARDLSEGRMTFDFARPVSWRAIWGGRFLGAVVLTLLVLAAVLLPTSVVGPLFPSLAGTDLWQLLWRAVLLLLSLMSVAHAVSIAIRSRSKWLAVDLVCGVVFLLLVAWAARELAAAMAMRTLTVAGMVLGTLAILVFWIGSATQVAIGRTDLVRGHAALSRTLWPCLLTLAVALVGYTGWLLAAAPDDLDEVWGTPAPRGSWTLLTGTSPARGDYMPTMLYDTATGAFARVGPAALNEPHFSADGTRVILLRHVNRLRMFGSKGFSSEIVVADLAASAATLRETTLSVKDRWPVVGVSEDGRRVAALDDSILSVHEIDSGRTLASAKFSKERGPRERRVLYFAGADRVRLCTFHPHLEIHELDVVAKRLEKTGETDIGLEFPSIQPLPGDRLFMHEARAGGRAFVLDARTGAVVHVYEALAGGSAKFRRLSDGRVVAIDEANKVRSIRILTEDGREERTVALAGAEWVRVGGEAAPGKLVLTAGAPAIGERDPTRWRVLLLDADSGELRETARGLLPVIADPFGFLASDPPAPGAPATRLFQSSQSLVLHDPLTGEKRVLAGRDPA